MENLLSDLRYSLRLLRHKPAYTSVLLLTLALGIAAVTSVFSLVNAVLLRPYGPIDTDRWVYLWEHRTKSQSLNQISASIPNFRDWRSGTADVFSDMVVWLPWSYTASGEGINNPERVRAAVISPDVFSTLSAPPALGRLLATEDSTSGERRILLSYDFWHRAYGGDPNLPGKSIRLNGATHTVIGIAPPGFAFPPKTKLTSGPFFPPPCFPPRTAPAAAIASPLNLDLA